jgi:bifunctional oligoribonuclease and PAP phosphatase NrnA
MMKRIIEKLMQSERVLVASHSNPDGDAIGALLATGLALQSMHKKVHMYNESVIPAVYRFLPSVSAIKQQMPREPYDTVVVLDCGDIDRIGDAAATLSKFPVIINIDHHVTNTRFGHLQWIDPAASATAEIVYHLINALPVIVDYAMATAIYTGILTDTGSFRFSNTNQSAFAVCAEMIGQGANAYEVAKHVYGTYSLGRIKLLNLALDSLEISPNGRLSVMTLTQRMLQETRTQAQDIDGIINYARRIEDVEVAALIHELGYKGPTPSHGDADFHVSLRSDGSVDVSRIAAQFGGGGHAGAAGFSSRMPLAELKNRIFEFSKTIPEICNKN